MHVFLKGSYNIKNNTAFFFGVFLLVNSFFGLGFWINFWRDDVISYVGYVAVLTIYFEYLLFGAMLGTQHFYTAFFPT